MQHWESTLKTIQDQVPAPQFQRWFKQLSFLRQEDGTIYLGVPTRFHQDWLSTHYKDQLNLAIHKNFGNSLQLEFEVLVEDQNLEASSSVPLPLATPPAQKPSLRVLPGGNSSPQEETEEEAKTNNFDTQLPSFPSEFFELDFNRLCYQYCGLFAQGTTQSLNPLVLIGGVGMGKTHLLAALGKELSKNSPQLKLRYTHAEKFTNEMFLSWKNNSGPNFQRYYRDQVDILLFDDLQGLSGRRATQEALLHIYNEVLSRGGRVVFTSSVPIQKLNDFIEPLKSRLLSGVSAEIKVPNYDEKLALLSLMAQQNQIQVEETVLRVLADQGHKDIRELLGVFLRLHLQSRIERKPLDAQFLAKEGLNFEAPQEAISMSEIVALVEHSFGISKTDLISKSRKGVIAWARQVAMYLGRRFTVMSLEEIGKVFGRDHATVLYAYEKVSETLRAQPSRKYEVEFLVKKLQARISRESNGFPL